MSDLRCFRSPSSFTKDFINSSLKWGTTWLSADFAHFMRLRLSCIFKNQKLYHIIKKHVIYKTLLPTDLPMCAHRIKGMYFYMYKSCTEVHIWTWDLDFASWTLSPLLDKRAGRRDKLMIIINTRTWIFNDPTISLLYYVLYNLPANYLLLGKCGENTCRIVLKRVNYSILFGVVEDEVKRVWNQRVFLQRTIEYTARLY